MAVTYKPVYPQTAKTALGTATTATSSVLDSADNTVELATIGTDGARVIGAWMVPRATTVAGNGYLFVSKDSGATKKLMCAVDIAADTFSAADPPAMIDFETPDGTRISDSNPLILAGSDVLYGGISQTLSDGVDFFVMYQEF